MYNTIIQYYTQYDHQTHRIILPWLTLTAFHINMVLAVDAVEVSSFACTGGFVGIRGGHYGPLTRRHIGNHGSWSRDRLRLSLFLTCHVVDLFFSIFSLHRPLWVTRRLPCVLWIRTPTPKVCTVILWGLVGGGDLYSTWLGVFLKCWPWRLPKS